MTSTALTPMQSFQEKLKDKIRDDIASMLPDEVISEMAQRVVNEEFFTKRQVKMSAYGYDTKEVPSAFQEAVLAASKPLIDAEVKKTLAANAERIAAQFDKVIADGILQMTLRALDEKLSNVLEGQGYSIKQALEKIGER
jgi:hypothetical protein